MAFSVKILADSTSPQGIRLSTLELTYPRIIHAEVLVHRVFSRNAASSRAIPVTKLIEKIEQDPFIPAYWGKNQSGMQAENSLDMESQEKAKELWLQARDNAIQTARQFVELGLHKQLANRVLEPFQWYTSIVSATEWDNFFALRCHPDAQPEIRTIAELARDTLRNAKPKFIDYNEWHLPLVPDFEDLELSFSIDNIKKISIGRCARVSYLTHDGVRDPNKDIELCDRLIQSGHMSPTEHIATPSVLDEFYGNFKGWVQFRKHIPGEAVFTFTK